MNSYLAFFISSVAAYLLGSINTSIIISKLFGTSDIREHGSGNAGATNTLRVLGKKAAILVVIGDALKGVLAVLFASLVAKILKTSDMCIYPAGLFAVIGHIFPLYFRFRGGKGIMTSIAVVFTLNPAIGWILVSVFAAVLICSNYVSLSSVISSIVFPVFVLWLEWGNDTFLVCSILMAILAVVKHRTNIVRLFKGTESKLIKSKKQNPDMKYKYYLFDFDGTLVDSMPVYVSVMLGILDENSIEYGDDIVKIITPLGLKGTANYMINLGLHMTEEELIEEMGRKMLTHYVNTIPAKNNVCDVLRELKDKGAHLNVLTASPHITLDPCLKRIGIYDLFDNVWSCDDFKTTKADPEIYKMAAEKIGREVSDILFLDDNYNADKTAKKAGMNVCGVYDESSKDGVEEIKSVTDHYIYDFSELLEL